MGAVTGLPQAAGNAIGGMTGGLGGGMPNWTGGGGPFSPLLGTAGGAGGTGFAKPTQASIQPPVTQGQIDTAQGGVGNSLASQQTLINALGGSAGNLQSAYGHGNDAFTGLAGLNGIGTMGQATQGTGGLAGQLGGAGGIGAQTGAIGGLQNVLAQQQGLAGQYGDIAAGRGPNPAQAMLNNATGQNVANQGALMAGQRGAGANVGLMARQAAQQGAATQQQAAGQGAAMQAQQQMNALSGLGAQQQAMAGTNAQIAGVGQGLTGQQMTALNQLYGQGAGTTGMQQSQIGMNAGIAQNQVGNQMGATNQFAQNNLANAGQTMGAGTAFNQAQVSNQGNVNTGNTALANTGMQGQQGFVGGLLGGAGAAIGKAEGGEIEKPQTTLQAPGAQSSFGRFLSGYGASMTSDTAGSSNPGVQQLQKGTSGLVQALSGKMKGGAPSGGYAGSDASEMGSVAAMAARGGPVGNVRAQAPDQKATKPGNDYANDKIPAMLSEGEVVLPRSVMSSQNPAAAAQRFVAALQAKKGRK